MLCNHVCCCVEDSDNHDWPFPPCAPALGQPEACRSMGRHSPRMNACQRPSHRAALATHMTAAESPRSAERHDLHTQGVEWLRVCCVRLHACMFLFVGCRQRKEYIRRLNVCDAWVNDLSVTSGIERTEECVLSEFRLAAPVGSFISTKHILQPASSAHSPAWPSRPPDRPSSRHARHDPPSHRDYFSPLLHLP